MLGWYLDWRPRTGYSYIGKMSGKGLNHSWRRTAVSLFACLNHVELDRVLAIPTRTATGSGLGQFLALLGDVTTQPRNFALNAYTCVAYSTTEIPAARITLVESSLNQESIRCKRFRAADNTFQKNTGFAAWFVESAYRNQTTAANIRFASHSKNLKSLMCSCTPRADYTPDEFNWNCGACTALTVLEISGQLIVQLFGKWHSKEPRPLRKRNPLRDILFSA